MARFFVPLDVNYQFDDKILSAGPIAECLYVRSLALVKRTATEGRVHRTVLASLALGLPGRPAKHADALVDVGLWEVTEDGWYIAGWLKHNLSNEALTDQKAKIRAKSVKGNHQRHHIDKGVIDPDCELCTPPPREKEASPQGPKIVPTEDEDQPKTKTNRRPTEDEDEDEDEAVTSSVELTLVGPLVVHDDDGAFLESVIQTIASERLQGRRPANPAAYRTSVLEDLRTNHRPALEAMLAGCPWLTTPAAAAAHYQARPELHPKEIA